ncbi:MAG TPA: hypothetical protein VFO12_04350 [Sphingomicrobium sp.]|nr:hypothetical protein [Sphingomicrobium sp.]
MKILIAFGLSALLAAPGYSSPVSVAGGDWSNIPAARAAGLHRVSSDVIAQIEAAAVDECKLPGQSKSYVKLSIPFLIQFSPSGEVEQVVVHRLNCPGVEQAVGGAILTLAEKGEYRPTGENLEHWYRGEFRFVSR